MHCPIPEIFFGGARGGGKTDAAIGKMLIRCLQFGKGERGLFVRRTYKQLEEVMLRAQEIFPPHGGKWRERDLTWTFPSGAWIKFAYLERDSDAMNHQGKSYTCICIEEAGTFPSWGPIAKLKACLRTTKPIPVQMLLTGNPGGPGSNWVRARYIDPCPAGWTPIKETQSRKLPNGEVESYTTERIYIPSRVTDNQILLQQDPNYIGRLMETGSENLVKAWLEGDFYVVDGAFFDNYDSRLHDVRPFPIPPHWTRFRAMDWGSARPFCCLWIAQAAEDHYLEDNRIIPKDALVVYREWYGVRIKPSGEIEPNIGVKLYAEEVAHGIIKREKNDNVSFGVIDPSAAASDGGPSIVERMARCTNGKLLFRRADNKRVGPLGALSGWDQIRGRLGGDQLERHGGKVPMLYFFNTCTHLLRTLPMQQHDADRPEDIDTEGEDHAVDALRYGCMARPWSPPHLEQLRPARGLEDMTLDELWESTEGNRRLETGRI